MASLKFQEQWAELLSLVFVLIGFIISVMLRTPFLSYISVFLSGFLAGRVYFIERYKQPVFPLILIILGFLVGYIAGSFRVSRFWTLVLFLAGIFLSYYLHWRGFVAIFKSKDFIK